MRCLIVDTNLYIDWLNVGKHEPILFRPDAVKFMSTVVMMELLAGAYSVHGRTRPHDLFTTFTKLGRIVTPSSATYQEAGTPCDHKSPIWAHGTRAKCLRS